jgi:hypothetical protein
VRRLRPRNPGGRSIGGQQIDGRRRDIWTLAAFLSVRALLMTYLLWPELPASINGGALQWHLTV